MACLKEFLGNFNTFEEAREVLRQEPYNLSIRDDGNLAVLSFTDTSDLNLVLVRQANGVFVDKQANEILHYCFPKTYDEVDKIDVKNIPDDYSIEYFVDGSLLKLYRYKNQWRVGTSKHVDATKNYWRKNKSFYSMFVDIVGVNCLKSFYETLDSRYCYTYIMKHIDNEIVLVNDECKLIEFNRVLLENMAIERFPRNCVVDKTLGDIIDGDNEMNYIVYFEDKSLKILSNEFKEARRLRDNKPTIFDSFISKLGNKDELEKFKSFNQFSAFKEDFEMIEETFEFHVKQIYRCYKKYYVYKSHYMSEFDRRYKRTLLQLNGQYKENRKSITIEDVRNKLLSLKLHVLSYIIFGV
jgi:hypothetical protein